MARFLSQNPDGQGGVVNLGNSEAWNIAEGYTKLKILKILIDVDYYEMIAKIGYKDLEEKKFILSSEIPERRVEALERVLFLLKQLIGNCKFAIGTENLNKLKYFMERLDSIENVMNGVAEFVVNDVTKENYLTINEEHFKLCFDMMRRIKDETNYILNDAGLIFRQGEDVDLDKIAHDIIEGG